MMIIYIYFLSNKKIYIKCIFEKDWLESVKFSLPTGCIFLQKIMKSVK